MDTLTWYSIRCPEGLVIPPTQDVGVALMWLKTMHDMEYPGYRFNGAGLVIVDEPAEYLCGDYPAPCNCDDPDTHDAG